MSGTDPRNIDTMPLFNDPMLDPKAVRDDLKGKSVEEIRAILEPNRIPFSLLMENDMKDISRGGLVRCLNAFSGQRCIIYGQKRRIDRRACVGSYLYENFDYAKNIEELKAILKPNSKLIAVELTKKAIPVYDYKFDFSKENILMIGHESADGLDQELRTIADDTVYIPMRGSIRSMNVICAFSVAAYEFDRQYRLQI